MVFFQMNVHSQALDVQTAVTWSLEPGSTDLATTQPDWRVCRWPHAQATGVCVDGIWVAARVALAGGQSSGTRIRVGYGADISDPDQIRVVFVRS